MLALIQDTFAALTHKGAASKMREVLATLKAYDVASKVVKDWFLLHN